MLLFYLGCGSIFLLAFILLSDVKGINTAANRWMGIFYLFAGFAMLGFIAGQTNTGNEWPFLVPVMESTRFAMAPAHYFAILHYTSIHYRFRKNDLLHFIPALLFLPILFGASRYLPPWMGIVVGLSIKLQIILYWISGYLQLRKHGQHITNFTANTSPSDLSWLKNLMLLTGIMIINQLLSSFFRYAAGASFSYVIYLAAIYLSCYYALKQDNIFPPLTTPEPLSADTCTGPPRLHENETAVLKAQLDKLMRDEKLYTDQELSLPQLAEKLDLSLHELSWLLNKEIGKNFYQYINHFRVEQAKELLQSPRHLHLSILAIGFDAGFNSKTTFNSTFKKMVGMTPREFRDLVVRMDAGGQ
ncbi:helix-turn-helix transcriptional regulator [Chitinophaga sp. OAE865]|uniref:helix-turn-helix domain-containing protein n=1 Tax=Chitinophaga sp. OAE865 TaxID=2817898 RepID=UPI001AE9CA42